jgi:GxxExxY protein
MILPNLIIGAAIQVHKNLGPGLLESVYHRCLEHEFRLREIEYSSELAVPVTYKGLNIDTELRCDFLVENLIVVELKAVNEIIPLYEAQLLTYMKLLKRPKGVLINFNCVNLFKDGQKTYVNNWFSELPYG